MLITLNLTNLELDFSGMEEEATPSPEEQARLNQSQLETPVVFEVPLDDFREYFHLDTLQNWAIDEISNRSGWCVAECSFAWTKQAGTTACPLTYKHLQLKPMTTTTTKPTITLNASTLTSEWEGYLLDRIMNEDVFWTACEQFVEECFDDMTDDEQQKIQEFIQGRTQVIIKSAPFEWDKR